MYRGKSLQKKSSVLIDMMLQHLEAQTWRPGDRLPSEREMCEAFGASRTVVREALSALQLAGLIEARPGDGTYVLEQSRDRLNPVSTIVEASVSIAEALEAREAMDVSVAYLAIENASDQELGELSQLLLEMEQTIASNSYRVYINQTLEFHIGLAKAGGNLFISRMVEFLIDQIRPSLWIVEQRYDHAVALSSLTDHRELLDAITSRDLGVSIQIIQNHYRNYPVTRRDK